MMSWKQVSISTTEEAADVVSSILIDAGAGGVEIEGGALPEPTGDEVSDGPVPVQGVKAKAYFGEDGFEATCEYIRQRLETLRKNDTNAGALVIGVDTVADTDWNENFRKHFKTFRAAGNIVIKPTWEDYEQKPGDIVIEMDPGMAFGSGVHEPRACVWNCCRSI